MGVRDKIVSSMRNFDYLVIGGGSAGIAGARKAAEFGAKVAVVEQCELGGTCVNVGCIPKKIMFYAADYAEKLGCYESYGFRIAIKEFSWRQLKLARCDYIKKLNGIYLSNLGKSNVEVIKGVAHFKKDKTVEINGESITAKHILIATGCQPLMPREIPGYQHGLNSDDFFALEVLPKNAVIVGAGYVATEIAGILKSLGSKVTMLIRQNKVLRQFDSLIADGVTENLENSGIKIIRETEGVELKDGFIKVDEYQNTTAPNVYAVGDVCGKALLTPVAIAASRLLSSRIFNNETEAKLDYSNIPSAIYSHPPAASIGLSQETAELEHGKENIKCYTTSFTPLQYSLTPDKKKFIIKLVCLLPEEKVVGLHMVGDGADEILQGFSVAIKMGATKKDLDNTLAIHPTCAEELVLMK